MPILTSAFSKFIIYAALTCFLSGCFLYNSSDSEPKTIYLHEGPVSQLHYRLESVSSDRIRVTFSFLGNSVGVNHFKLPGLWAGANNRSHISNVRLNSGLKLEEYAPSMLRVWYEPKAQVTLSYEVSSNGCLKAHSCPVVNKDYFHLVGHNSLVVPVRFQNMEIDVSLEFDFPKHASFANSFFSDSHQGIFKSTAAELRGALFVGGDFRISSAQVDGQPVFLAARGYLGRDIKDSDALEILKQAATRTRRFFDDHGTHYHLAVIMPDLDIKSGISRGVALHRAMSLNLDPTQTDFDHRSISELIFHEYFHVYNGQKMQPKNIRTESYSIGKWAFFQEGFTSYYEAKMLGHPLWLKNAMHENKEFYQVAGLKNQSDFSAEFLHQEYYANKDARNSVYFKGALYACYLDQRIQKDSQGNFSLDNFMQRLFKKHPQYTLDKFEKIASELSLKHSIYEEIQEHFHEGKPLLQSMIDLCPSSI